MLSTTTLRAKSGPDDASLQAALGELGLADFRPLQKESVVATISGKDVFLVLPTGEYSVE